jgi:pyrimidine 5'-nucleotidase
MFSFLPLFSSFPFFPCLPSLLTRPHNCQPHLSTYTQSYIQASGYEIDFDDWHDYVHARLPYSKHLSPNSKLRNLLDSITIPKYIFTNADAKHADICLSLLGLQGAFNGIICFESIMADARAQGMVHDNKPVVCKPSHAAFRLALQAAGGYEPEEAVFFDDSTRNVTSAKRIGIYSVLVGRRGAVDCVMDHCVENMLDVEIELPWLWNEKDTYTGAGLKKNSDDIDGSEEEDGYVGRRRRIEPETEHLAEEITVEAS